MATKLVLRIIQPQTNTLFTFMFHLKYKTITTYKFGV